MATVAAEVTEPLRLPALVAEAATSSAAEEGIGLRKPPTSVAVAEATSAVEEDTLAAVEEDTLAAVEEDTLAAEAATLAEAIPVAEVIQAAVSTTKPPPFNGSVHSNLIHAE